MPMRRVLKVVAGLLLAAGAADAQTTGIPARLTLDDALRLAVERNPAIAAARNAVEAAEAQRVEAGLRPNPAVSLESEGYPLFDSRPSFVNNQELTLRLDQEVETSGRRRLRLEGAQSGVAAADAQQRDRLRRLQLDVRRAYFQAALARADSEVAQTSLTEIDQVITLNRARLQEGEISGAELRRLQVERLRFVDDVFAAQLALRNARSALLALLNAPDLAQPVDVVEPLEPPAGPITVGGVVIDTQPASQLNAEAFREGALANRPDLTAIRQEQARADTETRLQRALRTPNVTVGGGYRRDFGANGIVFGVTVPLPISNRNQGGIARAEAERRRVANEAIAAETTVRLEVQQAVNAVQVNRERVDYIRREYLENARQSRDIVLASYRLGAGDLIDYLDAQRAYRDTQRTYNRALFDERISLFELAAATGTAPLGSE